jgi:hypothetical protein
MRAISSSARSARKSSTFPRDNIHFTDPIASVTTHRNHYANADPQTVWPPVTSFSTQADVKELRAHLETAHAAACRGLAKMNNAQLEEWKLRQENLLRRGS